MAANRPDDLDPEAWYEAAVRINQNRATNEAFWNSVEALDSHQPLPRKPKIAEDLSEVSEDETRSLDIVPLLKVGSEVLDIKNMSADDIHNLLQQLSTVQQMDKPSAPPPPKKIHFPPLPKSRTHPPNRYQALVVEEAPNSEVNTSEIPEATCAQRPRRPRWERRLPLTPEIGTAGLGRNSLYLRVEVESTGNQQKYEVCALVDSGATGLFIDHEYVKSNQIPTKKLSVLILVRNVDGTINTAGAISEVAELILQYNGHSERALFSITSLGSQNLILGHTWLEEHNPEVDWKTGKAKMSRCSPRCCNGCRNEAREERKALKKEAASVNACQSGPFPATVEDEASDNEPPASNLSFDIEEGDQVWATGLIPEAQYICATSTISQRLAESFAKNMEPNPTLLTGGKGSGGLVPDYIKTFGQVFSEEGFAKLPNRKPWNHAIELVPEAEAKGC